MRAGRGTAGGEGVGWVTHRDGDLAWAWLHLSLAFPRIWVSAPVASRVKVIPSCGSWGMSSSASTTASLTGSTTAWGWPRPSDGTAEHGPGTCAPNTHVCVPTGSATPPHHVSTHKDPHATRTLTCECLFRPRQTDRAMGRPAGTPRHRPSLRVAGYPGRDIGHFLLPPPAARMKGSHGGVRKGP